ncbi:MAG: hypothetical protein ACQERX_02175 [Bacillota bacterium]
MITKNQEGIIKDLLLKRIPEIKKELFKLAIDYKKTFGYINPKVLKRVYDIFIEYEIKNLNEEIKKILNPELERLKEYTFKKNVDPLLKDFLPLDYDDFMAWKEDEC